MVSERRCGSQRVAMLMVGRITRVAIAAVVFLGVAGRPELASAQPADGCYALRTTEATPRYLRFDTTTDLFSLAAMPQPFAIRRPPGATLAERGQLISTSSGEYLVPAGNTVGVAAQAVLTAAPKGGGPEFELAVAGQIRKPESLEAVSWSSIVSGPGPALSIALADDPTTRWTFEVQPQRSCAPGGPVTVDPDFVYQRSHLRSDGCFLIETSPVPGYGLHYVIPTHGAGGSYILTTDRADALRRGKVVILKTAHTRANPPDPANDTSYNLIYNDADFNETNFPGAGPREMMFAGQDSYYNQFATSGVKHATPVDTLEPPAAESLRYRWNIRPGPRGSIYENVYFFQNSLAVWDNALGSSVYPWLSRRTVSWLGQNRLLTLPDIFTGEAAFLLEPVACSGPSSVTNMGATAVAEYLSLVRNLPNDAINPNVKECIDDPPTGGTPATGGCHVDMQVVISGGSYLPLNAGNVYMGRASGLGFGHAYHRYLDEVDRCSMAHDKGYWSNGLLGNETGLMACYRRVVPKTQQEARHKMFALNNLLTSGNQVEIGDADYLQPPNNLDLLPVNASDNQRKPAPGNNAHPCTGILDPSQPDGWRPHPLCTTTQIQATSDNLRMRLPRVPGDADGNAILNKADKDVIRAGFGSIGLIYDRRDTNQDRVIDEADVIRNTRPVADAGAPTLSVDQTSPAGAVVTLDGSASSDADPVFHLADPPDTLTYTWTWPGGSATGVRPTITLPVGTTRVTLSVDDGYLSTPAMDVIDVTVRDLSPPVLTHALSLPPNQHGWHRTNVTVTFACTDNAGVAVPPVASHTFNAEGAGQTFTASCTDVSGLVSSLPVTVSIDRTAPTISAGVSPAANGAGWRNTDVTVTYTCSDALSGVDSCTAAQVLTNEGAGQSRTGSVTDRAGNTGGTIASGINVDKTPPTISAARIPEANPTGWDTTDVTVRFSCADTLSGVAACAPPAVISTYGVNQRRNGTATDAAGNSASAALGGINIDKTPIGDPLVLRMAGGSGAPGGGLQARLELGQPRPIGGGEATVSFGALSPQDMAIHGAFGDAAAAGVIRGTTMRLRTVSPSSGIGATSDLPIVTATLGVPAGAPLGAVNPLAIVDASFAAPSGAPYAATPQGGSVEIAAASITDVSPGSALVPAGGVITVTGTGFEPGTAVLVAGSVVSGVQVLSTTRLAVTLGQATSMHGREVTVTIPSTGHQLRHYASQRTASLGRGSHALIGATEVAFPRQFWSQATLRFVPSATAVYGFALQSESSTPSDITLTLVTPTSQIGPVGVQFPAATRASRTIAEVFGLSCADGCLLRLTASTPLQFLGLAGDTAADAVTPILPSAEVTTSLGVATTTNAASYRAGDLLVVTSAYTPGAVPAAVDAYHVLQTPSGELHSLTPSGLVPGIHPHARRLAVRTSSTVELLRVGVPAGTPPGTYRWLSALAAPDTLNLLTPIHTTVFDVVP